MLLFVLSAVGLLVAVRSIHKPLQRIETMGIKTDAAVAALLEEVTDSSTKLASAVAFIENVPNLVAAAVADALAAGDVNDEARAAIIDSARASISDQVDAVEAAINDSEDDAEPVVIDPVLPVEDPANDPETPPFDPAA